MELAFEELEIQANDAEVLAEVAAKTTTVTAFTRARPRRELPEHLPRERVVIPAPEACPCCGSDDLSKLGEDITETLEVIPRQWKVIQTVRERFSCRQCGPSPNHQRPSTLPRAASSGQACWPCCCLRSLGSISQPTASGTVMREKALISA